MRSITIGIVVSRQLYAFCHNIAEIITAMNSPKSAFFIYSCYHYSDKYFVRIMIALHADIVLSYEKHLSCGMSSLNIMVSFQHIELLYYGIGFSVTHKKHQHHIGIAEMKG